MQLEQEQERERKQEREREQEREKEQSSEQDKEQVNNMSETELRTASLAHQSWAHGININSPEVFQQAASRRIELARLAEQIRAHHKPMKEKAWNAHRAVIDQEKIVLTPVTDAISTIDAKMRGWQESERRRIAAINRELQAKAAAQAEAERQAALAKAAKAKRPETVEKWEQAAASVVTPVVQVAEAPSKPVGLDERTTYKATVDDFPMFARWCVMHQRWELLAANAKALDNLAKSLRTESEIPGVKFEKSTHYAKRRGHEQRDEKEG